MGGPAQQERWAMSDYKKISIFAMAIILFVAGTALAGGLSSRFIEVKMKDLEQGKAYSVKEMTGRMLDVNNTTEDVTTDIAIEPEKPVDYNLVPGYEPIPDLSWVKIEKSLFEKVGPGASVETDISITIPKGKEHAGKKYQVYIYSHTAGDETFRTGLMGRVLIEIKEKEKEEKGKDVR